MVNGDGEFNCELCGYTARNWSKMKEHMIRHSEGTPFACSYCDSKYKRPADLNRHLKIKHNTCLADIGLDGPTLKGVMGSFPGSGKSVMSKQSPIIIASSSCFVFWIQKVLSFNDDMICVMHELVTPCERCFSPPPLAAIAMTVAFPLYYHMNGSLSPPICHTPLLLFLYV